VFSIANRSAICELNIYSALGIDHAATGNKSRDVWADPSQLRNNTGAEMTAAGSTSKLALPASSGGQFKGFGTMSGDRPGIRLDSHERNRGSAERARFSQYRALPISLRPIESGFFSSEL